MWKRPFKTRQNLGDVKETLINNLVILRKKTYMEKNINIFSLKKASFLLSLLYNELTQINKDQKTNLKNSMGSYKYKVVFEYLFILRSYENSQSYITKT